MGIDTMYRNMLAEINQVHAKHLASEDKTLYESKLIALLKDSVPRVLEHLKGMEK